MNKAILVIDMPSCCYDCFALDDSGDYPFCLITHEQRGYTFRVREQRMSKCPFRPVPDKMYEGGSWTEDGYIEDGFPSGWNACIEEILG
jgi:hypothetical protein